MSDIWLYSIGSVLLVSIVSLVGVFAFSLNEKKLGKVLMFFVSFSAGALFGDAFIHLLPEAVETLGFGIQVSLSLLGGIMVFFILEKFICWRHCHVPTCKEHPHPLAIMNLIGDGVHNFLDGIIIAGSYVISLPLGIATTIAVILHEIPQEIGNFGVLMHGGFTRKKALFFNFLSALLALAGALFALAIGTYAETLSILILPFTAGGFIYIAGSDLIPEMHKETKPSKSLIQFMALLLGIGVMLALAVME